CPPCLSKRWSAHPHDRCPLATPRGRANFRDCCVFPARGGMAMTTSNVRAEHVVKRFSGHVAVDDVSMQVPAGSIFGLLGPNGAGKTTMIRLLMGILEPDE